MVRSTQLNRFHALLLGIFFLQSGATIAQDTTGVLQKNEIGFSLNRYLPDLTTENRPYLFALEYRRYFKSGEDFDHYALLRVSGNYNRLATIKPYASKLFLGGELGYHARKTNLTSKWHFLWGAKLGWFNVKENVTPQALFPQSVKDLTPFSRSYFKLALSPGIGVEYEFAEGTSIQAFFSAGFGTRYFGDVSHLKSNNSRGFSAQFPSIGLFQKF